MYLYYRYLRMQIAETHTNCTWCWLNGKMLGSKCLLKIDGPVAPGECAMSPGTQCLSHSQCLCWYKITTCKVIICHLRVNNTVTVYNIKIILL